MIKILFLKKNLNLNLFITTHNHNGGLNKIVVLNKNKEIIFKKWQEYAKTFALPECMYYKLDMHNKADYIEENKING